VHVLGVGHDVRLDAPAAQGQLPGGHAPEREEVSQGGEKGSHWSLEKREGGCHLITQCKVHATMCGSITHILGWTPSSVCLHTEHLLLGQWEKPCSFIFCNTLAHRVRACLLDLTHLEEKDASWLWSSMPPTCSSSPHAGYP
jgi:hypothetical protein